VTAAVDRAAAYRLFAEALEIDLFQSTGRGGQAAELAMKITP